MIGGSSGIGLETARRARTEAADVIIAGRNPDRLKKAAAEVGAQRTAAFDATGSGQPETFFQQLPTPIDHVLVTGPGPYYAPLADLDRERAHHGFDAHLWLAVTVAQQAGGKVRAGDSAGGGLAVALLVAARDAGQALPAAAVLMSPTVDLTSSGASMTERADQDPISTPAMLRRFASDYLAGADPKTPLASPLFASLSGLPPLLIQVGTADLLLSDSERLAAAAAEAGVDVTLEIGEGLTHVYQLLLGTPEAAQATEQIRKFLRTRVR